MTIRILLTIIVAIGFATWVAMPSRSARSGAAEAAYSLAEATSVPQPPHTFVGPMRPVSLESVNPVPFVVPRADVSAEAHWAFQPLERPAVPTGEYSHPIDALLTAKPGGTLKSAGDQIEAVSLRAQPAAARQLMPHADARTLVRRLWFDVLGLPPTIEDVASLRYEHIDWDDFVSDVLDRPEFGERWARHWLDVARYADSNGYEYDEVRWNAYPYRDWVIRAINDDLPYDDFVRWQIAGDELLQDEQSERSVDAMTATGFLTAGPHNTFFPQEVERYDELDDVVHTVGQAFLGLSVGCARCHDHMTEPISQREYYQLVAVFQSTARADRYLTPDGGAAYLAETAALRRAEARANEILEVAARDAKVDDLEEDLFTDDDKELLKAPIDPDNERQAELLRDAGTRLRVYDADIEAAEPRRADEYEYADLVEEIEDLAQRAPDAPATTLAIQGSDAAPCWVLENGDVDWKGDEVEPGFLACLGWAWNEDWRAWDRGRATRDAETSRHETSQSAKPRSALAHWLTDVDQGAGVLVARVAVNRVWQHYFGRGLVATPNNFGLSGDAPEHPDVLEYLAAELIDHGWSMKHVHHLILTSAAYRQASAVDPFGDEIERSDELSVSSRAIDLAYPLRPRRLDGEVVRDAAYAVSGQLNTEMFGPPVQPPIPSEAVFQAGEQEDDTWPRDAADAEENWRRSIYIQHRRSNPFPLLALFGKPEAGTSCAVRPPTVVPTQTLAIWNEPWLRRQADLLARDLIDEQSDPIVTAYVRVLQRNPSEVERRSAIELVETTSLETLVHALMVSNEFLFVD